MPNTRLESCNFLSLAATIIADGTSVVCASTPLCPAQKELNRLRDTHHTTLVEVATYARKLPRNVAELKRECDLAVKSLNTPQVWRDSRKYVYTNKYQKYENSVNVCWQE